METLSFDVSTLLGFFTLAASLIEPGNQFISFPAHISDNPKNLVLFKNIRRSRLKKHLIQLSKFATCNIRNICKTLYSLTDSMREIVYFYI